MPIQFNAETVDLTRERILSGLRPGAQVRTDLESDPMLWSFARIGSMLSSRELGLKYLKRLNDDLVAYAKKHGLFERMTKGAGPLGTGVKDRLRTPFNRGRFFQNIDVDLVDAGVTQQTAVIHHKHYKVLSGFLTEYENARGFNEGTVNFDPQPNNPGVTVSASHGKHARLPGIVDRAVFRASLQSRGRHFKDPSVSPMHGEYTHRIQWYMVSEFMKSSANFGYTPLQLFTATAAPKWCVGGQEVGGSGVWDYLFEGSPNNNDFRKAETTNEFLLLASAPTNVAHADIWFLAELAMGRYAKRAHG